MEFGFHTTETLCRRVSVGKLTELVESSNPLNYPSQFRYLGTRPSLFGASGHSLAEASHSTSLNIPEEEPSPPEQSTITAAEY
jgi:hypothetical protein